jgi:hypothetical protein
VTTTKVDAEVLLIPWADVMRLVTEARNKRHPVEWLHDRLLDLRAG